MKVASDDDETEYDEDQVFAEAIAHWVGRQLKVPQPAGALTKAESGSAWCSEFVRSLRPWSPQMMKHLADARPLGAILVLDAICMNDDRHEANLQAEPLKLGQARVVAIDNAGAGIVRPAKWDVPAHYVPAITNIARPIDVDVAMDGAFDAAALAMRVDEAELRQAVREACRCCGNSADDEIAAVLLARMRNAQELATRYLSTVQEAQR